MAFGHLHAQPSQHQEDTLPSSASRQILITLDLETVSTVINEFLTPAVPILTTGLPGLMRTCTSQQTELDGKFMTDLIYIGVVVVFFVVSGLYVRFCEKM